jgi:hypothetical protein
MRLLTVATASYVYLASVMFTNALRMHPELRPTLLVTDVDREGLSPVREALGPGIEVLCCDDLGFGFIPEMRAYYGVLEFCSAMKALGSAYILRKEKECLFLDPDILVLDSLNDSLLCCAGDIVVSAHTFAPYPSDGEAPNDLELCQSGFINGGVLLTRRKEAVTPALDWLVNKACYQWFVAPEIGLYGDQHWLSLLFYLFRSRTALVEDRGVNVAYWNLHERPLRKVDGRIRLATGEPLRLMHFSGFAIPSRGKLSRHTHRRFDMETEAVLFELIQGYELQLEEAMARLGHLQGNLKFCSDPLPVRLQRAAERWNATMLKSQRISLRLRVQKALLRVLQSKL